MNLILLMSLLFAGPTQKLEEVVYATGYIANVQFAPFYVAQQRGYYKEEGLSVKLDYTMGPDIFKLTAMGKVHIASADSDAFLHASVRGLPLVHVGTLYQRYPIALISKQDILTSSGLKGKRVGISGTYGSSYLGLKAILAEMDLKLKDIRLTTIGYTQVASLQNDRVDAVVGYINNEPIRLKELGVKTKTRNISKANQFPGVGMMTSRRMMEGKKDVVYAFLRATYRGMDDVIKDPEACYKLVVDHYLPELKSKGRYESELQVLKDTIAFWSDAHVKQSGYGQTLEGFWINLANMLAESHGSENYKNWHEWVDLNFNYKP